MGPYTYEVCSQSLRVVSRLGTYSSSVRFLLNILLVKFSLLWITLTRVSYFSSGHTDPVSLTHPMSLKVPLRLPESDLLFPIPKIRLHCPSGVVQKTSPLVLD